MLCNMIPKVEISKTYPYICIVTDSVGILPSGVVAGTQGTRAKKGRK